AVAPASASISAERSPVWAPDALGWQSWAPIARAFAPCALSANAATSVAGGQTSKSALAATPEAPASIASSSAKEALRPFIFQLPAISGRMASGIFRALANGTRACASRAGAPVPETLLPVHKRTASQTLPPRQGCDRAAATL